MEREKNAYIVTFAEIRIARTEQNHERRDEKRGHRHDFDEWYSPVWINKCTHTHTHTSKQQQQKNVRLLMISLLKQTKEKLVWRWTGLNVRLNDGKACIRALNSTKLIRIFCHSIGSFFNAFNLHVRYIYISFFFFFFFTLFLLLLFMYGSTMNWATAKNSSISGDLPAEFYKHTAYIYVIIVALSPIRKLW